MLSYFKQAISAAYEWSLYAVVIAGLLDWQSRGQHVMSEDHTVLFARVFGSLLDEELNSTSF